MISVESTVTQAVTAISTSASVSQTAQSTGLTTAASNVTSSFLRTAKELLRNPLRITSHIDQSFINYWNRFVPESLGRWLWLGTEVGNPAVGGGAIQTMADAALQPGLAQALGETGPASWPAFFAEIFQASTFKSYWGMLHYLTSRWAFTCFAMVSLGHVPTSVPLC